MGTAEGLRIERNEGVGLITLQSSDGLNILSSRLLENISDNVAALEKDEEVRVIIITGEKNFSVGADIKEMRYKTSEEAEGSSRLGHRVCSLIENMGKAAIAAVRGYALGGGCELALVCDMRIVAESAKFGQPEINLGLIPGFGATQRLPGLIGIGRAKEMILTGRIMNATEAESIGLVNKVVKDEELIESAMAIALQIAQKSPSTVRMVKELINGDHGKKEGIEQEILFFSECFRNEDHSEGINAFLEKRKPKFRGK